MGLDILQELWSEGEPKGYTEASQLPFEKFDIEMLHTNFKTPSRFNPYHAKGTYVETFYTIVSNDLQVLWGQNSLWNNLAPHKLQDLYKLQNGLQNDHQAGWQGGQCCDPE